MIITKIWAINKNLQFQCSEKHPRTGLFHKAAFLQNRFLIGIYFFEEYVLFVGKVRKLKNTSSPNKGVENF